MNDPEVSQEYTSDQVAIIESGNTAGQSFISRRPHINGITVWVSSPTTAEPNSPTTNLATIKAEIFQSSDSQSPIYSNTFVTYLTSNIAPITINLPNLGDAPNIHYYLNLSSESSTIRVLGRNEDSYSNGQAYVNGSPITADIAFRATYNYDETAFLLDFRHATDQVWIIFPLLALVYIPGWLLLDCSGLSERFDLGERLAIAIGISLSIIPVLMLWTTQLNITWSREGLILISSLIGVIFIFRIVKKTFIQGKIQQPTNEVNNKNNDLVTDHHRWYSLGQFGLLIAIFTSTLTIRLIMVRDLATPAWVDSVHHALFTRLILNNGNYPSTYLPVLDIPVTAYHLGFHSIVAAFTWLSEVKIDTGLLLFGQILNALIIFSVYLLAKAVTKSTVAGLISAIITGFLTPMPAYYTSWGRYTELTGLIILPVAFIFLHSFKFSLTINQRVWMIFFGAITTAGLFMIHYRVIVFLALLIISYLLTHIQTTRGGFNQSKQKLLYIGLISAVGIILVFPWMVSTIRSTILPMVSRPVLNSTPFFQDFSWAFLTAAFGKQALVLAVLGMAWAFIYNPRFTMQFIIWIFLLFLMANLGALRLPGAGLINTTSVEIMLFIPISIFGGYLIDQVLHHWRAAIPRVLHPYLAVIMIAFTAIVSLISAKQLVTILNPITILTRSPDLIAIDWVQDHIPVGEEIVINPTAWGYGIYAGNDGGYWISSLAGNPTIPAPVLYGLGSSSGRITEMSEKISTLGNDPSSLSEYLLSSHIKYVFIGARGGVISPEKLNESGLFNLRYHQSGDWIFEVKP